MLLTHDDDSSLFNNSSMYPEGSQRCGSLYTPILATTRKQVRTSRYKQMAYGMGPERIEANLANFRSDELAEKMLTLRTELEAFRKEWDQIVSEEYFPEDLKALTARIFFCKEEVLPEKREIEEEGVPIEEARIYYPYSDIEIHDSWKVIPYNIFYNTMNRENTYLYCRAVFSKPKGTLLTVNGIPINYQMDLTNKLITSSDLLLGGARRGRGRKQGKRRPKRGKRKNKNLMKGGQLGFRNPRSMHTFPPCVRDYFRYQETVGADGSGQISAYFSLRNPTAAINGSGTYTRARNYSSLFDEYKILSLVVIVNDLVLSTQNGVLGMSVDYDSQPTGTYTLADIMDTQYYEEFSGTNQISYVVKDVPVTSATSTGGVDCIIHQRGWYDFLTPPTEGYVVMAGSGFAPNTKFTVTLTLNVKMRARRTVTISREKRLIAEQEEEERKSLEEKEKVLQLKQPSKSKVKLVTIN